MNSFAALLLKPAHIHHLMKRFKTAPRHIPSNSSHMSAVIQCSFDTYVPNWKLHLARCCGNSFSGCLNLEIIGVSVWRQFILRYVRLWHLNMGEKITSSLFDTLKVNQSVLWQQDWSKISFQQLSWVFISENLWDNCNSNMENILNSRNIYHALWQLGLQSSMLRVNPFLSWPLLLSN